MFDLLVGADGGSTDRSTAGERRRGARKFRREARPGAKRIRLSPATKKLADAKAWLERVGTSLDGVIAKRRDLRYRSGDRSGMQKIKSYRSADCVVGGFRYNEGKTLVGSLLLGLYDREGLLHHVGFTSTIKQADKPALTRKLKGLIAPPGFTGARRADRAAGRRSGRANGSRCSRGSWSKSATTISAGSGFRHGTRLLRWRPDKAPRQCTLDQVEQKKADLMALLEPKSSA